MTRLVYLLVFRVAALALTLLMPARQAVAQAWLELFGQPTITGAVRSIAKDSSMLYVSGRLLSVGDKRARGLATFDTQTNSWAPVRLDLGDGFSSMSFYDDGLKSTLFGAGLPGRPLVMIEDGQVVDTNLDGTVSGLRTVILRGQQVLVASGSFNSGGSVFGLALWNGRSWGYRAELTPFTRQLTILNRDGRNVIYALSSGDDIVVEYDGLQLVFREVPLLPDVSAISHLGGVLAACDRNGDLLNFFDGISWALLLVLDTNNSGCRNLTPRRFEDRDQIMFQDIIGNWRVYEAGSSSSFPLQLPIGGDKFTKPIPADGETALVTLSARQASRQLAIWEPGGWVQPEQEFQSTRLRAQLRSAYSHNNKTYVFGRFGQGPAPLLSAVGIFGDEGITNLTTVPDQSSSAVMDDSGIVYAWTPEGLWVDRGEDSLTVGFPDAPAGAALALAEAGELFVAICGKQLLRLEGEALEVVAELPEGFEIFCNVPPAAIPESSPATGIFFSAAEPSFIFESGRRVSVWRFDGNELSQVSPPGLAGYVTNISSQPQVSPITLDGNVFPALAFGSELAWFDGQQWNSFPTIPDTLLSGGEVSGPVATANVGDLACVFATLRTQMIQFCDNQWSTSSLFALSFLNTIDVIFRRGVETLITSEYRERPVLLVGGPFDAVGESTQSRTAVLDLDAVYKDSFEF